MKKGSVSRLYCDRKSLFAILNLTYYNYCTTALSTVASAFSAVALLSDLAGTSVAAFSVAAFSETVSEAFSEAAVVSTGTATSTAPCFAESVTTESD